MTFALAAQAYSRHEPVERSCQEQGTLQLHIESSVGVDQLELKVTRREDVGILYAVDALPMRQDLVMLVKGIERLGKGITRTGCSLRPSLSLRFLLGHILKFILSVGLAWKWIDLLNLVETCSIKYSRP